MHVQGPLSSAGLLLYENLIQDVSSRQSSKYDHRIRVPPNSLQDFNAL